MNNTSPSTNNEAIEENNVQYTTINTSTNNITMTNNDNEVNPGSNKDTDDEEENELGPSPQPQNNDERLCWPGLDMSEGNVDSDNQTKCKKQAQQKKHR
eukprot:9868880-Ditylum_brightwellii.AAC.1